MFKAATTDALNKSTVRVGVVDDHCLFRMGLIQLIHSLPGFEVVLEAANGKEFQEKIQRSAPPEIVLLDIKMPVMDGFETALWIQTHFPQTRLLVVSMVKRTVAIIRMLRLGVYGFVSKDASVDDFQKALYCIREKQYYVNELAGSRMFHYFSENPGAELPQAHPDITNREFIFLRHCCTELSYREIAKRMHVSPRTIDTYRDHLFEKLQVRSRVGLVLFAIKFTIIELGEWDDEGLG